MFDDLERDVRYAYRSFRRTPLFTFTIIATVGLGLGLVVVVFTALNAVVFRADDVRRPDELFAVERPHTNDAAPATFTRAQYDGLLRDTRVFSDAFASTPDINAWIDGSRREGRLVTGNFFQLLGVNAALGRALTPQDDEPGRPPVIVLSHDAWTRHFAKDPNVLERTVRVNGVSFQIVGVAPQRFRGLEAVAAPDFWAPLSLNDRLGSAPPYERLHIVGRFRPSLSRAQALTELLLWDSRQPGDRPNNRSTATLVLEPRTGTIPLSAEALLAFMPLFFAFGLILAIGCANVANLLLARGLARQREIGVRLAVGASRRRLISQLLTESLLLALCAAAVAFGISRLVLEGIVYAVTMTFPPDIGNLRLAVPPADWRVALFLVAGAIVATVFFALAPALQATRVELVRAIHGEVIRDPRPGRARNLLVAVQVTGSAMLLICAMVFLRSSWAAAAVDPGIRTAGIISVAVLNEQKRPALLEAINSEPLVGSFAASWPGLVGGLGAFPALATGAGSRSPVTYQLASPEYFGILGIDLLRGRGFTRTERSANDMVAIVSESAARQLWPVGDAVGQTLYIEAASTPLSGENQIQLQKTGSPVRLPRAVVVVGVARDVAGLRLGAMRLGRTDVYLPIGEAASTTVVTVRVRGDAERARRALVDRIAAIDPNLAEVSTLQTIASAEVYLLSVPFWLTLALGMLALALTISGLFSVLSYVVEQRRREIGVRVALGATSRSIASLVLSQAARAVGTGMLLGSMLTATLGALLLATPAAEPIGTTIRLFDPVAYSASVIVIVSACASAAMIPALRAARMDPLNALRQD